MTITINRNLIIFVVALLALLALGYFIGTRVAAPTGPAAMGGGPAVVTATLPAAAQAPGVPTPEPDLAPRVEVEEFKQEYDANKDLLVVDVRVPESYAAGHIVGAVNIPEAEVPSRLAEIPKDKHVVLYCACPAEQESGRVGTLLMQQGYSPELVKVFRGGYTSWNSLGYPVATAAAPAGGAGGAIQVQPAQPGAPAGGITVMTVVPGPTTAPAQP